MSTDTSRRPSPLRQLVRESSLYTLGNALRRSFGVITMPVFTRYLSTSGYGVLAIVGTVQNMLEVFFELGMAQSSTRFYYDCRTDEQRRRLFGTLLWLSLAVTFVLSLVLLLAGDRLWSYVSAEVPFFPYVALTIATVFLGVIGVLPRALFRVRNEVPRFFRLSVSQSALTVVLAVTFVVWLGLGPLGPILATGLVAAVFFGVYAWHLRGHVAFAFDRDQAARALRFGLPEIPVRWGSWALKVADRLILQHFTSLAVVGIYSVGYSVSKMPFDLVANSIHWAIVPFFYATATRETEERSQALFARVATWNLIILAGLGVMTVIFGGELIGVLASSRYAAAEAIIPIIVAAEVLEASFYIPSKGIYLKGKTPYLLPLFTVPAALNIGLNFVLIPRFGMMGAAWATLAAYAVMLTMTLVVSQRIYPIPYEYGTMAKVLAIAVAVAAAGRFVPETSFLLRLAIKLVLAAAFPLLLYVTGAVDQATLAVIRERLGRYLPGSVRAGSHAG